MVYCVQGVLTFSTAARRDAVLADMQARAARPRWNAEPEQLAAAQIEAAAGIIVELRFTAKADATGLMDGTGAFATGVRAPLAGSWMQMHDCGHDEAGQCGPVTLRMW